MCTRLLVQSTVSAHHRPPPVHHGARLERWMGSRVQFVSGGVIPSSCGRRTPTSCRRSGRTPLSLPSSISCSSEAEVRGHRVRSAILRPHSTSTPTPCPAETDGPQRHCSEG